MSSTQPDPDRLVDLLARHQQRIRALERQVADLAKKVDDLERETDDLDDRVRDIELAEEDE